MADYVPENTARLRVLQTGPRGSHKMMFRGLAATSVATLVATARAVCEAMKVFCITGTSFVSADYAPEGSNVFLPVTWGAAITQAAGIAVDNNQVYGAYLNWVGRSIAGSRVLFYLYNVNNQTATANNRLTVAESAPVGDVADALTDLGGGLVAIDQNTFVIYPYANSGVNDHVARKSRLT